MNKMSEQSIIKLIGIVVALVVIGGVYWASIVRYGFQTTNWTLLGLVLFSAVVGFLVIKDTQTILRPAPVKPEPTPDDAEVARAQSWDDSYVYEEPSEEDAEPVGSARQIRQHYLIQALPTFALLSTLSARAAWELERTTTVLAFIVVAIGLLVGFGLYVIYPRIKALRDFMRSHRILSLVTLVVVPLLLTLGLLVIDEQIVSLDWVWDAAVWLVSSIFVPVVEYVTASVPRALTLLNIVPLTLLAIAELRRRVTATTLDFGPDPKIILRKGIIVRKERTVRASDIVDVGWQEVGIPKTPIKMPFGTISIKTADDDPKADPDLDISEFFPAHERKEVERLRRMG